MPIWWTDRHRSRHKGERKQRGRSKLKTKLCNRDRPTFATQSRRKQTFQRSGSAPRDSVFHNRSLREIVLALGRDINNITGSPNQPRSKVRYAATNLRGIYKDWSDGKATGDKEIIKEASSTQSASNTELFRYSANTRRIRRPALASWIPRVVVTRRPARYLGRRISAIETENGEKVIGCGAGRRPPPARTR